MPNIRFEPLGKTIATEADGETVLQVASRVGIPIESVCGGRGKCGRCMVQVRSGMAEITLDDRTHISPADLEKGMRLACRLVAHSDLVVEISEQYAKAEQVILEEAVGEVKVDPLVRVLQIMVEEPTLANPSDDHLRLRNAIERALSAREFYPIVPLSVLTKLPGLLAKGGKLNVVLREDEVLDLDSRDIVPYGVAIDVGSTTVVAYLMDLRTGEELSVESELNPQIRYGDDVVSRITYAMTNPAGTAALQNLIIDCLNNLIGRCCSAGKVPIENVFEVMAVGNTAMHHFMFGLESRSLALAPYNPVTARALSFKSEATGLRIAKEGYHSSLPNVAGFVGADHIADLLAVNALDMDEPRLVIDIGTNGELSVCDRNGIASASVAAGPAFEGANLRCGMRGTAGAIDHVQISEDVDVTFTTINESVPRGLCGSGVIDLVAEMFLSGVMDRTGRIRKELGHPRIKVIDGEACFVVATTEESGSGKPVMISQSDIIQIQYAKAAMFAGAEILMEKMKVDRSDIKEILLAGAFGNYASPGSARAIGLFPEVPLEHIVGIGNAAGSGAKISLVSRSARETAKRIAKRVQYVELAAMPEFEEKFYAAMYFPHSDESKFPQVSASIKRMAREIQ
jgi:uncharacterized 2Fe-2S/4Fe-4S cluster protein (DUF4445 family)